MKVRDYVLVTAGYWAFTITDGTLRMLVLLYLYLLEESVSGGLDRACMVRDIGCAGFDR